MVSSEIPPAPAYLIELRRKRPLLFSIDEFTAGIYCSQKTTSTLSDANKTSNNSLKFQSKTELQRLKEFTDAAGEVSTFRCKTDNRPVKSKLTPTIMVHDIRAGKDGPLFCPATFSGTRGNASFIAATGICLDFDKGQPTPEAILAIYPGTLKALYSTHSHTPEAPRYRVVLPLSRTVDAAEHVLLGKGILEVIPKGLKACLDVSCLERARAHYLPSCPPEQQDYSVFQLQDGEPLDVDSLIKLGRETPTPEEIKRGTRADTAGVRPGDDYKRRHSIVEVLQLQNWQHVKGDKWLRPGNDSTSEYSAKVYQDGVYVHSSNAPVPVGYYDAFGFITHSKYGGDYAAATKDLAGQGYGGRAAGKAKGASSPAKSKHTPFTMADLIGKEFKPIQWTIPSFLPEGLTILSGPPKIGKSWLVMDLGIAVSSGGHALGHFKAEQGAVLLLSLEDNERRLQSRLSIRLKNDPGVNLSSFHALTSWERLDNGGLEALDAWLQENPTCKLVVIDTIQKIKAKPTNKNGNAYENDYEAYGALQRLALERQCCILLIHHNRKSASRNEDDPLEAISGSIGITGAMDTIMMLTRPRGGTGATLTITGRDIADAKYGLTFDPVLCGWSISASAAEAALQEGSNTSQIMEVMKENPGQMMTVQEVFEALGEEIKISCVKTDLYRLAQKGLLQKKLGKFTLANPVLPVLPALPITGHEPEQQ